MQIEITKEDFEITPKGARCNKFKYIDFNRQFTDRKKFKALKESLNKLWINIIPIVLAEIDGELYLVDGQGRLACIYGLLEGTSKSFPVQIFVNKEVTKGSLMDHVIECNNTSTPWDILDYLKARIYFEKKGSLEPGAYELLSNYIEEYAHIAYKTVISVLGKSRPTVLEDVESPWINRFGEGLKVLDVCDNFPGENIRYSNRVVRAVDWCSRNATDIDLNKIFDNLTQQDIISITIGKAETAIGILLDSNGSKAIHKSRFIADGAKKIALTRAKSQCEAEHNGKRCTKKNGLQFHHDLAHSVGGGNKSDNIHILCDQHNNIAKTTPVKFFGDGISSVTEQEEVKPVEAMSTPLSEEFRDVYPGFLDAVGDYLETDFKSVREIEDFLVGKVDKNLARHHLFAIKRARNIWAHPEGNEDVGHITIGISYMRLILNALS